MGRLLEWFRNLFSPPAPEPGPDPTDLADMHNHARTKRDFPPLQVNPLLQKAAENHAAWMAARQRLDHNGNGGVGGRLADVGYAFYRYGENIAQAQTAKSAFDMWMQSTGHRRNILGDFTEMGFGSATSSSGTVYWCAVFATPR